MLQHPNDSMPRNASASIIYLESAVRYWNHARYEAARYNGGAPLEKVKELLREGELADEEHVMNTTMIKYVST